MRRRSIALLFFLLGSFTVRAAETDLGQYQTATIATVKTSIYIGNVTLTTPPFARKDGVYSTTYNAKVFPFFFYNEHGTLSIDVSDDMLRQLARGETVAFSGQGMSSANEPRRIEGKATPADATTGKIKVRVFVSKKIQLIFNTTYRFTP